MYVDLSESGSLKAYVVVTRIHTRETVDTPGVGRRGPLDVGGGICARLKTNAADGGTRHYASGWILDRAKNSSARQLCVSGSRAR